METTYFFDTLPIHPRPEHLESFTSYLTRLAEANGLKTISSLAFTCFFDQNLQTIRWQKDNPPVSFGILPAAAKCSISRLLATTFFHLGKKFERSSLPQPISHFLSEETARSLRFCPHCIAECPYYLLTWRFLCVSGCARHSCFLLDICSYCGFSIPIFAAPLKIGTCPNCKADLRSCATMPLTESECDNTLFYSRELEFLLLPQPWEAKANAKHLGAYFADLRQRRNLTMAEVAHQLGITRHGVESVEYGNIGASSAPFKSYIKYARFLRVSLRDVFAAVMTPSIQLKQKRQRKSPLSEEEMVDRVQQAIQRLKHLNKPVTQRIISKMINVARPRLNNYPLVKALLEQEVANARTYRERQRELLQEEVFEQVRSAIGRLESLGAPVTQKAICEIVGMTPPGLKGFPKVKELLAHYVDQHYQSLMRKKALREEDLVAMVEIAISRLKTSDHPVTQTSISRAVGIGLQSLKRYPRVRKFVEQYTARNHKKRILQREDELVGKVEEAVRQLKAGGEAITQRAIGEIVGVDPSSLKWYPRIAVLLEQHASKLHYDSRGQSLTRERELMTEIEAAIAQLEAAGQPITQRAIARIVGVPLPNLKIYEGIDTRLKQVASRAYLDHHRAEGAILSENEMVVKVKRAIEHLETSGEPVTQRAVSRIIGIPAPSLYHYPKVIAILKSVVRDKKHYSRLVQTQLREDDLVTKVLEAIESFKATDRRVSIRAVVKIVQLSEGALKRYSKVKAILDQIVQKHRPKTKGIS
jgi:transcriptional regulator with XRE-family HTH domain